MDRNTIEDVRRDIASGKVSKEMEQTFLLYEELMKNNAEMLVHVLQIAVYNGEVENFVCPSDN